jgi:hypothetical protein
MKLLITGAAVLLTRLALASLVIAQVVAFEPPAKPVDARLEIGPLGGMAVVFPEFGVLASVPVDRRTSVEIVVSRLTARFDSPQHALAQIQLRIPFREHLQSRKSFVLGLTRALRPTPCRRQPAVASRPSRRLPLRRSRPVSVRPRTAHAAASDDGLRVAPLKSR